MLKILAKTSLAAMLLFGLDGVMANDAAALTYNYVFHVKYDVKGLHKSVNGLSVTCMVNGKTTDNKYVHATNESNVIPMKGNKKGIAKVKVTAPFILKYWRCRLNLVAGPAKIKFWPGAPAYENHSTNKPYLGSVTEIEGKPKFNFKKIGK